MPKKKPEMSQVYSQSNNEFIFGENGGRGKHLSSFLRNLSLTGSSRQTKSPASDKDDIHEVNSNIYGSMAYSYSSPDQGGTAIPKESIGDSGSFPGRLQRTVSSSTPRSPDQATRSNSASPAPFLNARSMSSSSEHRSYRRQKYADLDDDWDAQLDEVAEAKAAKRYEGLGKSVNNSSGMIDSLHPDLMASSLQNRFSNETHKDSMDSQDLRDNLEVQKLNRLHTRFAKFCKVLKENEGTINLVELRKLSWNGIPSELRAMAWQLLLGYLPANKSRQAAILKRKRQDYSEGLRNLTSQVSFDDDSTHTSSLPDSRNKDNSVNKEKQLYHQINIDVKRTNPTIKLYSYPATQKSLRQVLYLWAIRHPASGYVQGINDLCTPFYQIFLNNYLWQLQRKHAVEAGKGDDDSALFIPGLLDENGADEQENAIYNDPELSNLSADNFDPSRLSERVTSVIEADVYWCISRLLDNITDNYIHEQPGIIKQVNDLRTLIAKIDVPLLKHLESEGVEFIQFSFRWMNCLLMRELSMNLIVRMWDTYLSETPLGFNIFHVYVCAAFLIKFSPDLRSKDFQDILLFLQNPPTSSWNEKDIELMLSEAFIWQSLYKNASAHLR